MVKKIAVISWLTALCFMLLSNVHAWDVPQYMRLSVGSRLWFSLIEGDLIQRDRTKLDVVQNLGLKQDQLAWEHSAVARMANIHVLRVTGSPRVTYNQSINDSSVQIWSILTGYDFDFFMTPQALIGANIDLEVLNVDTCVNNVTVAGVNFSYEDTETHVIPSVGLHGTFYPVLDEIALRPNLSGRVNWWSYRGVSKWDFELTGAVDLPVNRLWTWSISGGYRIRNDRLQRSDDTIDLTRQGFFLETSILY